MSQAGQGGPSERGDVARVARNTVWLTVARVGGKALGMPVGIILARVLGPADFGAWATISSLVVILAVLSDGGFHTLTVRDVSADPDKSASFFNKILAARLILSLAAALGLVAYGLTGWDQGVPLWLFPIGAALLFPEAILRAGQAMLNGWQRIDLAAKLSLGQGAVWSGAVCGAVLLGGGVVGAAIAWLAGHLIFAGATMIVIKPIMAGAGKLKAETRPPLTLFRQAFPYGLLTVLHVLYSRVDVIMLSSMAGLAAAGVYGAALRLFEAGLIVSSALAAALLPVISRQLHDGLIDRLLAGHGQAIRLLIIIALPAALMTAFYGDWIMGLFFGPDFASSGLVLTVLGLSWIPAFINAPLGTILASSTMMGRFAPWIAANTGLNVLLNWRLIPLYGPAGAAGATLICEITGLAMQYWFAKQVCGQWPPLIGPILRPALAAAGLALLWGLTSGAAGWEWLTLLGGLVAYTALLFLVKGLGGEDWRTARRIFGRSPEAA